MIPLLNKVQLDQYIDRILKYGFDGLEGASKSEMKQVIDYIVAELFRYRNNADKRYEQNMMIIGKENLSKEQRSKDFFLGSRYWELSKAFQILKNYSQNNKSDKPKAKTHDISFLDLLSERGKQIAPKLKELYPSFIGHPKTKRFAHLIIALDELELTSKQIQDLGSTKLKNLFDEYFGNIGSTQALGQSLKALKENLPNSHVGKLEEEYEKYSSVLKELLG
jgi:hypothetical protein